MSLKETELKLLEAIKKTQEKLKKLRQKRKLEIGELAIKYGLDDLTNEQLEQYFKTIGTK